MSAELEGLELDDSPAAWERLGFTVDDHRVDVGGVKLRLADSGGASGILMWWLRGAESTDVDGLHTARGNSAPANHVEHPNGAIAIDHVVVMTPHFEVTRDQLSATGLDLRRERDDLRGVRMAFFRAGPTVVELVENPEATAAGFWGLVVVVSDIDATAALLGDRLGQVKDAVQPGRRIATVHDPEGPSTAVAFMTPRA